jgi:hypothetical protein
VDSALEDLEGSGPLFIVSGSLKAINNKIQSLTETNLFEGKPPFENRKGFAMQYDLRGLSIKDRRRIVQLLIDKSVPNSLESPCQLPVESRELGEPL